VPDAPGGAVLYWHVDDLAGAVRELLAAGAREHQPITERGSGTGFVTASVIDPFGNILGVMSNPHYPDMLAGGDPHQVSAVTPTGCRETRRAPRDATG
jgi:hypothetical protein